MNDPAFPSDASDSTRTTGITRSRVRWWTHLLVIGAYPAAIGILGSQRSSTRGPVLSHNAKRLLITCVLELLVFAAVFGLAWLASRASRDELLLRWRNGILPVPLGIAYSFLLRIGLAVVGMIIIAFLLVIQAVKPQDIEHLAKVNQPDVAALVDISALRHNPLYFWLSLTVVSFVVAGLREELWRSAFLAGMRALWPATYGSRAGQISAIAIAAIIFGVGHLTQGAVAAVGAGLLGLGLGIIMVVHRSIWPAVIAHGIFDATTFAILPWLATRAQ